MSRLSSNEKRYSEAGLPSGSPAFAADFIAIGYMGAERPLTRPRPAANAGWCDVSGDDTGIRDRGITIQRGFEPRAGPAAHHLCGLILSHRDRIRSAGLPTFRVFYRSVVQLVCWMVLSSSLSRRDMASTCF